MIVSRAKEAEWDNDPKKRPLPSLFKINVSTGAQKAITNPKKGFGDFNPIYQDGKLYWARSDQKSAQLMVAQPNGKKARPIIKNMDNPPVYYENRDWQAILSIH